MSQLIDWHAHILPAELVEALEQRELPPLVAPAADGGRGLVTRKNAAALSSAPSLFAPNLRLDELDAAGIDVQVLSVPGMMGIDTAPRDAVDDLVKRTNLGLSRIVAAHPSRFRALASVPLYDPELAARVLAHAVDELGHIGAILPVDAFLTPEAGARYASLLAVAQARGAHIFVHPGPLPDAPPKPGPATALEKLREGVTGIQNGLTEAAITLEFSELLDPYPDVSVQVANLGGALAYYQGRWAHTEHRLFPDRPSWDGRLRRILVDTGSLGARAISFAAEVFGADRLLFGTDAPIYSQAQGAEAFRAALGVAGAKTPELA